MVYGLGVITFHAGKEGETQDCVVKETLIRIRSPFVAMASRNDWKESRERKINLADDDPSAFQLYEQWVYTGHIFTDGGLDPTRSADEYKALVSAYILGEKLMDADFKDIVIDCIIHKLRKSGSFDIQLTSTFYENTPQGSTLRRLWVDIYGWAGNASWVDEKIVREFIHPEFSPELNRLVMSFVNGYRPAMAPYMINTCAYHEHKEMTCHRNRG